MGKLIAYLFFLPSLALASMDCNRCSSGDGLVFEGLKQPMLGFVKAMQTAGIGPISCVRTKEGQQRLVSCFNACGQYGRASTNSAHTRGEACDWSGRHTDSVQNAKQKLGVLNLFSKLKHGSGHGNGLHEKIKQGYVGYQVTGGPSSAPNAAHEPGNDYKPPKSMRKVCVRYKDSPWCQEWIRQGNKPGWYEYNPATGNFNF